MPKSVLRDLVLLWLGWVIVLIGFQNLVDYRYQPNRPDYAVSWSHNETARTSQRDKPYLIEPFMNQQVSWDSEFYISIALEGYDDETVRTARTPEGALALNYAFFPFYPFLMSVLIVPLGLLGMNAIATATLAGVLISALGTLGGMIALYMLLRADFGDEGGFRAGFYLLIFPTSFFLAQVYTEGLFIGLSFGCLAALRHRQFLLAALLAAFATWTRAVGVLLIIPLGLTWLEHIRTNENTNGTRSWRDFASGLAVLAPLGAYLVWRIALGERFALVEEAWFGRGLLNLDQFIGGLENAWEAIQGNTNRQMQVYYLLELAGVSLAGLACLLTLRRYPAIALYGLAALFISVTSGAPQSLIRYVLVIPSLYIVLTALGRYRTFDRVWTVASLLLMAMLATLFTFDMWVA